VTPWGGSDRDGGDSGEYDEIFGEVRWRAVEIENRDSQRDIIRKVEQGRITRGPFLVEQL